MVEPGTYEWWVANSKVLLAEAEKYNAWAADAKRVLLTDLSLRIYALSQSGYWGCGFHYDLEQTFGKLVARLSLPAQFSANHADKIPNERITMIITKVNFEHLVEQIEEAEWSVGKSYEECRARDAAKREASDARMKELLVEAQAERDAAESTLRETENGSH